MALASLFFILEYRATVVAVGTQRIGSTIYGVFLLSGALIYGPFFSASALAIGVGTAFLCLRKPMVKLAFTVSMPVVAFAAGWIVFHRLFVQDKPLSLQNLPAFVFYGLVVLFVSTLQFSILLSLLERRPLAHTLPAFLGREHRQQILALFTEISLAILLTLFLVEQPCAAPLLAIPFLGLHFLRKQQNEALKSSEEMVTALSKILDQRDDYTKGHSDNVTIYTRIIAEEMSLPEDEVKNIQTAARMHDLGKVLIRDEVLRKPGRLDEVELKHMKSHVGLTEEFLSGITFFRSFGYPQIAGAHHERWDGAGYPRGLSGEEIPLGARIMAVADVFDAMTCNRAYRRAMPEQEVVAHIERESGKQFDPQVVGVFLSAYKKGRFKQHLAYNRLWSLLQSLGYSYDLPIRAAEPIGPLLREEVTPGVTTP
ncbi:MAG: HD-GYP domain-containing protein [Armatimonadetes bacterium]|nr:HD-GYP domain-containing protein [Armatimonadota bacterium]